MATGYGLTGKIRGKLGSNVYRIEGGKQIISEYNPTKNDPKSGEQVEQRAKMALATRISSLLPYEAIAGFGYKRADARRRMVSEALKSITATPTAGGGYTASLNASDLIISDGGLVPMQSAEIVAGQTARQTKVTIDLTYRLPQWRVLLVMLPHNSALEFPWGEARYQLSDEVVNDFEVTITVDWATDQVSITRDWYFYAVPIVPDTIAKRAVYSQYLHDSGHSEFSIDVAIAFARRELYRRSLYLGTFTH